MHVGSWRQGLGYQDLIEQLIPYLAAHGFTHVEFLPLAEHPFGPSWGYQVTGYFAPTSRYGKPDDLRSLIDALHAAQIGVIMDWVPGHFPRDAFALASFDGSPVFEHPDPQRGAMPEWGTLVFDYGSPWVRDFLVSNALYWVEEFHVDGIRVDAVASMLFRDFGREPGKWQNNALGDRRHLEGIAFLAELTEAVHLDHPEVLLIAEDSSSYWGVTRPLGEGGLGFDLKWNMGWMNDSLRALAATAQGRASGSDLDRVLNSPSEERDVLALSHDEVTHGKGSLLGRAGGDTPDGHRLLRAYLAYVWAHPGKKLLFMGQEYGQSDEWSEARSLDWPLSEGAHADTARFVRELNAAYVSIPAMWADDPATVLHARNADGAPLVFARHDGEIVVVAAVNLTGDPVRWEIPARWGRLRVRVRSDAPAAGPGDEVAGLLHVPPATTIWLTGTSFSL